MRATVQHLKKTFHTTTHGKAHRAMLAYSVDSVSDEKMDGFVTNCHPYFFGKEYNKLVSDMQGLRDLIENTETGQRDAEEQENLHADLVSLGSRVEQDLAAIRVKLDQHFRQSPCRFKARWTPYVHEDNLDPLERGADGHVISDLRLIRQSRMTKMGRSPEAQYAYHIGLRLGLIPGLSMWFFARLVAPYLCGFAS
jgi:hypothetical protein